ncbi:SDR family oxidoreductase [Granulicoccus phenolivorans]|uniref:SDR family oxidoreductase n=1 Tax=Granulicoccus phenolivorans TaxID=266854 RepID=UPI00047D709D|nr:SDR family oxidoreductase [Granulicoccus phenolivorans]
MSESSELPIVVITGAGSGIGRALAVGLAPAARLVLAGRRVPELEQTAELCSGGARVVPTDITAEDQVERLFDTIATEYGRLDVLVNNAGMFGPVASVAEVSAEEFQQTWQTNVVGTVLCSGAAFRQMHSQHPGGGRIIMIGSISAQVPRPRSVAYTVTKHALTGLTRSINLDGRALGISATQVDVGNAATAMTQGMAHGAEQPDGSRRPEPTFDPDHLAEVLRPVVALPPEVSVPWLTVHATGMPYAGRG